MITYQAVKDYWFTNVPFFNIPYKFIGIFALAGIILFFGLSLIRAPQIIAPPPGSGVGPNPVFRFIVTRNYLFHSFETDLSYQSGEKIPVRISENGRETIAVPVTSLLTGNNIVLKIKIKKGFGPIPLWSRTFTHSYVVRR